MERQTKFKHTEIGLIPEDWEVKEIQEVVLKLGDGLHGTPKYDDSGDYYFINGNNLVDGKIEVDEKTRKCSKEVAQKYKKELNNRTILVSINGTLGNIALYNNEKIILGKSACYLNVKDEFNLYFIRYVLKNEYFQNYIQFNATGTTIKNVSLKQMREFKFGIPENIEEQSAIAKILSDLDSKIELTQQMNKTLEAIGQSLFKHWFIDFEFPNEEGKPYKSSGGEMVYSELGKIPKGWAVGKLGDFIDNIKDALKSGEEIKNRKYVPIDNLPMKRIGLETYLPYTEAKSSLIGFEKDDILVGAMRVYFHRVNLAPFSGVTRTTTFVLRPRKKHYLSYSLFQLYLDSTINYANAHSKGTTMPYAVWNNSLSEMQIVCPSEDILYRFNELIYPILSKIRDSIFEQQSLIKIRDSLLPKLMSGKIRVPIPEKETIT